MKKINCMNVQELVDELTDNGIPISDNQEIYELRRMVKMLRDIGINFIEKTMTESLETIKHATKLLDEYEITIKTLCRIYGGK